MADRSLSFVFDGWDGYNMSLRRALEPRTAEDLAWRPNPMLPSVGEVFAHLLFARVAWFSRMGAPGSEELAAKWLPRRDADKKWIDPLFTVMSAGLVEFLDETWAVVDRSLRAWTADDLSVKYSLDGSLTSRQWTFWRVLSHDIHHGGQICEMLYMQGIEIPELGDQGGHITDP